MKMPKSAKNNTQTIDTILKELHKKVAGYRTVTHRGLLPRVECVDVQLRKKLEKDPARWLKHFFPHIFHLRFSTVHKQMIQHICNAVSTGGMITIAAPRGYGKSAIAWGLSLYFLFTKQIRFPLVISWNTGQARGMLRDWLRMLQGNEKLLLLYPEFVLPFWFSTRPTTLSRLRYEDNNEPVYADVRLHDGFILLPQNLGAIGINSVQGNVRGTKVVTHNGEWLRPDFIFLDDPQDREVARSPARVNETINFIEADVMGVAAPTKNLTIVATVTVIAKDDVAEKLLNKKGITKLKYQHVESFPNGWEEENSETRTLWNKWYDIYIVNQDEAKNFYYENKEKMINGFQVSWQEKYNHKTEPDVYYSTMAKMYTMGTTAFFAEFQNTAQDEKNVSIMVSEENILQHQCERHGGIVPDDCVLLVAGTDINLYGLHSVVLGFTRDFRMHLIRHMIYDRNGLGLCEENATSIAQKKAIYDALVRHGAEITAMNYQYKNSVVRVQQWIIDAGYESEIVKNYITQYGRFQGVHVYPARGYDALHYKPTPKNTIGTPREQCHLTESVATGKYIAYNADYWREFMLLAFLGTPGNIGTISLPQGNFQQYAEHVSRIRLLEKIIGQYATAYKWNMLPGRHDWADATMLCIVGASFFGLSTKINITQPQHTVSKYVEKRKRKNIHYRIFV